MNAQLQGIFCRDVKVDEYFMNDKRIIQFYVEYCNGFPSS